ncbi:MAG: sulfotransferase [Flavobacteriales bacterium]|nr:sulfotransferase [Flavobacteriales bacterium]
MTTISDKQFLFVVGAPRSGTTWLHHMLAEHPDVASMEPELTVFSYLHLWEQRFQREKTRQEQGLWRQGAPLLYTEDEFYRGLRAIALDAYERLLKQGPAATHVLDKHPSYALHLPLINRLFPHCRVLHIIRDGREVAVSMMSAKKRIGFGFGEIRGASRNWATHVRAGMAGGDLLGPERYLEVRYEDLVARPGPVLQQVFRFAGLQLKDEDISRIARENALSKMQVSGGDTSLNALRKIPGAIWRTKLNLEERWTMDRMVGDLLQELGHARPGWWAFHPGHKARMALYPAMRRVLNTAGSVLTTWRTPVVKRLEP